MRGFGMAVGAAPFWRPLLLPADDSVAAPLPSAESPLRFEDEAAASRFNALDQGMLQVLRLGSTVGPTSRRHERGKWLIGIGGGGTVNADPSGLCGGAAGDNDEAATGSVAPGPKRSDDAPRGDEDDPDDGLALRSWAAWLLSGSSPNDAESVVWMYVPSGAVNDGVQEDEEAVGVASPAIVAVDGVVVCGGEASKEAKDDWPPIDWTGPSATRGRTGNEGSTWRFAWSRRHRPLSIRKESRKEPSLCLDPPQVIPPATTTLCLVAHSQHRLEHTNDKGHVRLRPAQSIDVEVKAAVIEGKVTQLQVWRTRLLRLEEDA